MDKTEARRCECVQPPWWIRTQTQGFGLPFQTNARVGSRLAAGDSRRERGGWAGWAGLQQPGRAVGSASLSCVSLGRQGFSGCFRPFILFDFHGLWLHRAAHALPSLPQAEPLLSTCPSLLYAQPTFRSLSLQSFVHRLGRTRLFSLLCCSSRCLRLPAYPF